MSAGAARVAGEARACFAEHLIRNRYPGRGLVVGRASDDAGWLQVYWIMGRSSNSRNRVFVVESSTLRTEPFDRAAVEDPSLILYEAMLERDGAYVVSNGDQTRTVRDALRAGRSFEEALETREREPDAPNYTPRISGLLDLRGAAPRLALSVLKANAADPARTDRSSFRPALPPPGLGRGLTTYRGDGDPLPPFTGEPLWLPLDGSPEAVLEAYWDALDRDNRVALAVKHVADGGRPSRLLVRNRHG